MVFQKSLVLSNLSGFESEVIVSDKIINILIILWIEFMILSLNKILREYEINE